MMFYIDNQEYPVIIKRKNNKNTYIRILEDKTIQVTTNYFVTDYQIKKYLDTSYSEIAKMIHKKCKELEKSEKFYYLGLNYDIMFMPDLKNVVVENNHILAPNQKSLDHWRRVEMVRIFKSRLDILYPQFHEKIPYPKLKIRTMKSRWGVCNRRDNSITLNTKLLNYTTDIIDYVIIHELSHFVHFDHSAYFWETVSQYCPNYKILRKQLKE